MIILNFFHVYFPYSKDETLEKFHICKSEVELQYESHIKRLRTDRGVKITILIILNLLEWHMRPQHYIHHNKMVWLNGKIVCFIEMVNVMLLILA